MTNLKIKINADYITAWKGKDEQSKVAKDALNNLKSKITEAEKAKKVVDLSDEDIMKVIVGAIKQRKDSIEQFEKGGREDLVAKEKAEVAVFEVYLPQQMTEIEIEAGIREIIPTLGDAPQNVLKGKTTGAFNKKYSGAFDMNIFKQILDKIIV